MPLYNEADSMPLVERVHAALADYGFPWELVLVDDGSSDETADRAAAAARQCGRHVRLVELTPQFQADRRHAGRGRCRLGRRHRHHGRRPAERPHRHPRLVARLLGEDLDLVAGWRQNRQDGLFAAKGAIPDRQPPGSPA